MVAGAGMATASAAFPELSVAYPYDGTKTDWNQLSEIRVTCYENQELSLTENAKATFTNLETDQVIDGKLSIELNWMKQYDIYATFGEFPSNGEWEFCLTAGSVRNAEGEVNPDVTKTYTLNDPVLNTAKLTFEELIPAEGSVVRGLGKEAGTWTFKFADEVQEQIGYFTAEMTDADPNHIYNGEAFYRLAQYSVAEKSAKAIDFLWAGDFISAMYEGYEYKLVFKVYDKEYGTLLGQATANYKGGTPIYQYAPETLVSVTPDPDTYVFDDDSVISKITMKFSGPVECVTSETEINLGQTATKPFASITSNDDKTEWYLNFNKSDLVAPAFDWYAAFTGSDGARVKGNYGRDAESLFVYQYEVEVGLEAPVLVSPTEQECEEGLDELSQIVLQAPGGQVINWSYLEHATIMTMQGGEVAVITSDNVESSDDNKTITINVTPAITAAGTYLVSFPRSTFSYGEDMFTTYSKRFDFTVVVKQKQGAVLQLVSVDPENGSKVDALQEIVLSFRDNSMVGQTTSGFPVSNDINEVVAYAQLEYGTEFYQINVYFTADQRGNGDRMSITNDGTYSFTIPTAAIHDDNSGDDSAEINLSYIIGNGTSGVAGIAADNNGRYTVYSTSGAILLRDADAAQLKGLSKGLYIINNRKVVVK